MSIMHQLSKALRVTSFEAEKERERERNSYIKENVVKYYETNKQMSLKERAFFNVVPGQA
jgi:hypothetical protein